MRECIFHFKLIRDQEVKELRALVILPKDKQPSISDFVEAFDELGYKVELENEHELIFQSLTDDKPYKLDITKIQIKGETSDDPAHDGELRSILEHLIR
jgi:hypothetical protein